MTTQITLSKPVTDDEAVSILTTALEGGYAEEFTVVRYSRRSSDSCIVVAKLRCEDHDVEGTSQWTVGIAEVALGLQRYAAWIAESDPGMRSYLGEQWREAVEDGWDCFDAIGADAVLQFACFGEVVFG